MVNHSCSIHIDSSFISTCNMIWWLTPRGLMMPYTADKLLQIMAWCHPAPSHYLKHHYFKLPVYRKYSNHYNTTEIHTCSITPISLSVQWVYQHWRPSCPRAKSHCFTWWFALLKVLTHCGLVMPYGNIDLSILAQVVAHCLTAPSLYLNQGCFIINEAHWHLDEDSFTEIVLYFTH